MLTRSGWNAPSDSLFWRDRSFGGLHLRVFGAIGGSLGAALGLQLAFLEFGELLLILWRDFDLQGWTSHTQSMSQNIST